MKTKQGTLLLLRGLPGAGKTTLASTIAALDGAMEHWQVAIWAADQHFEQSDGTYKFNGAELPLAHRKCQEGTERSMRAGMALVCVTNTFTTEEELEWYYDAAKRYNYKVHSVIVENRCGTQNVHGVPAEAMSKMRERFNVSLG